MYGSSSKAKTQGVLLTHNNQKHNISECIITVLLRWEVERSEDTISIKGVI